jgi:broad specificity phosphatase PhoE
MNNNDSGNEKDYHAKYSKYKAKYLNLKQQTNQDIQDGGKGKEKGKEKGNEMKEIYLVRHGETDWNKKGLGQGSRNDIEMNDNGKEQALFTGTYLDEYRQKDKKFDLVISSPLLRTKQTAEIICDEIGYNKNDIIYFDELKELDHGLIYIGKTDEELKTDNFYDEYFEKASEVIKNEDPIGSKIEWNNIVDNFLSKKYEHETLKHLRTRCQKIVEYIKKSKKTKIIIVTHGGAIINGFIPVIFNVYNLTGNYKNGSNCSVSYITYEKKKFNLLMPPSTEHFSIYDKNYSKK